MVRYDGRANPIQTSSSYYPHSRSDLGNIRNRAVVAGSVHPQNVKTEIRSGENWAKAPPGTTPDALSQFKSISEYSMVTRGDNLYLIGKFLRNVI